MSSNFMALSKMTDLNIQILSHTSPRNSPERDSSTKLDISTWMSNKYLKIKFLIFTSKSVPLSLFSISVNNNVILPVIQVKNLGIILDFLLSHATFNSLANPLSSVFNIQLIFSIHRFHISEFAYCLQFICKPKINRRSAFQVNHSHAHTHSVVKESPDAHNPN